MYISRWILLRRAAPQFVLALIALGIAIHPAGAAAGPAAEAASSTTVRYADLDWSRPDAAGVLYRRIQAAARRVCNASITFMYLQTAPARQECYRLTVSDAVSRANLAVLTALHAEGAGEAP